MNSFRLTVLTIAAVLILGNRVTAEVVYQQLPGVHSNAAYNSSTRGFGFEVPGYRTADQFKLAADASITSVQWWGLNFAGFGNDFQITFYTNQPFPGSPNSAYPPAAVLHSTGGLLATRNVNVGSLWDPVVSYSLELSSPFEAHAGTVYWVSIFNQAPFASWGWLAAEVNTIAPPNKT